jgi:hypothetical protein
VAVFWLGGGLENERRIGRSVLRLVGFHRLEIPGIGDDGRELLQLIELVHAGLGLAPPPQIGKMKHAPTAPPGMNLISAGDEALGSE